MLIQINHPPGMELWAFAGRNNSPELRDYCYNKHTVRKEIRNFLKKKKGLVALVDEFNVALVTVSKLVADNLTGC